MEAYPLGCHDDLTYLLETLFVLNLIKPNMYRSIISSESVSNKIAAIIDSSECKTDPQRMHLLTLSPENI